LLHRALKVFLSLWIAYHLANIVILANGGSFLGRYWGPYLIPYGNAIGLNSTWNFFSPDPAHTMYLEYRVRFEDEQGNEVKESVEGFLPPEKDQIVIDSSKRRLLYAMRFLLLDQDRLHALMAPWLCRQYPGSSTLSVAHVVQAIPPFDRAITNLDTPVQALKNEVRSEAKSFNCRAAADEVGL
jgi:hypothetical protein